MKPRHKRFVLVGVGIAGLALSAGLVLSAFQKNLVFFFTPTQVAANEAPVGKSFRIGGLVEKGSVKREADGVSVKFVVTDTAKSIPVIYRGILPDLFREGKGVVTQGKLGPTACSAPRRCWRSTTRITCRPRPHMPLSRVVKRNDRGTR